MISRSRARGKEEYRVGSLYRLPPRGSSKPEAELPVRGVRPPARDPHLLRIVQRAHDTRNRWGIAAPRRALPRPVARCRHHHPPRTMPDVRSPGAGPRHRAVLPHSTALPDASPHIVRRTVTMIPALHRARGFSVGTYGRRMTMRCAPLAEDCSAMRMQRNRRNALATRSPHSIATTVSGRPSHSNKPMASRSRTSRMR